MTLNQLHQESVELTAFQIRFIRYGSVTEPARWRTVEVMARSPKEALKAARNRYRRAAKFSVVK